jgi:hypothetical protein
MEINIYMSYSQWCKFRLKFYQSKILRGNLPINIIWD